MHILFLTDNFPPEGNAPASRTYEHAVEWVKKGCKVTVVTGVPNFPEGKVFGGYKNKWYQTEVMDGISVVRVKTYITANEGFAKRILDFLSFMVTSFFVSLFIKRVDVVVATSPQFFTACSGCMVSFFKRVPFVFELRDIWPASITAVGAMKKTRIIALLEKLEMLLYRKADLIVSVTNSFKTELISRGVPADKIGVVLNGVNLSFYAPTETKNDTLAEEHGLKGKFVLGYVGTHGMAHALDKVLECADSLRDNPTIRFLFVGGGAYKAKLDEEITQRNLQNVVSLPRQSKLDMPDIWSLVDVSLISLKDAALFKTVIPSKIFESMGMGLPMIMCGPQGEASEIISGTESGVVIAPENPVLLEEVLVSLSCDQQLYSKLKHNSLGAAKRFNRQCLASNMLEAIQAIMSASR